MKKLLDELPLATIVFVVGVILIVLGYIKDDITIDAAFENLLFLGGGSGAIGYVRNQAGKGVKRINGGRSERI